MIVAGHCLHRLHHCCRFDSYACYPMIVQLLPSRTLAHSKRTSHLSHCTYTLKQSTLSDGHTNRWPDSLQNKLEQCKRSKFLQLSLFLFGCLFSSALRSKTQLLEGASQAPSPLVSSYRSWVDRPLQIVGSAGQQFLTTCKSPPLGNARIQT